VSGGGFGAAGAEQGLLFEPMADEQMVVKIERKGVPMDDQGEMGITDAAHVLSFEVANGAIKASGVEITEGEAMLATKSDEHEKLEGGNEGV
jgi:hypothetical protein